MQKTMQKLTEKRREDVTDRKDETVNDKYGVVLNNANGNEVVTYESLECVSKDSVCSTMFLSRRIPDSAVNVDIGNRPKINIHTSSYRKWFVLGAGFTSYALAGGFISNLPILYVEWLSEFGKSNSETAVVQSVCSGTYYAGGIAAGLAIAKYGARKCGIVGGFITTLGLVASFFATDIMFLAIFLGISGFGICLAYISATVSVEIHFNGRLKVMALAFIVFGSGVGMSLYPILYKFLLMEYGWRGTVLIVGGIMFNFVFNSSFFKAPLLEEIEIKVNDTDILLHITDDNFDDNIENHGQHNRDSDVIKTRSKSPKSPKDIFKELLHEKLFLVFVVTMATAGTALNSVKTFMIDHYMSTGISHTNAINLLLYFNVASTVSRIFPALIKQLKHLSVLSLPVLSTLLGCISIVSLPLIGSSFVMNVITACCYGSGYGIYFTATAVTTSKLIDQDMYSVGFGLLMATIGVFSLFSGPIAGYIRDTTGNYDLSFYSASVIIFLCCVMFFVIMVYRHYTTRRKNNRCQY